MPGLTTRPAVGGRPPDLRVPTARDMVDQGSGTPVVVVQPLQGRWQWTRGFVDALARQCRVVTYTLGGDFGSDRPLDPQRGFDQYVQQLEDVIDRARLERTALCGISFGGTVAVRYAARHPERVTRLVIASSPGPGWRANAEQHGYIARPLLTLPVFLWRAFRRLSGELAAAFPQPLDRIGFVTRATATALRYPAWPPAMAARVRLMQSVDLSDDCRQVAAPTLVVSGHPSLDLVVPVESTRLYLTHIRVSQYAMMENTGHSGSMTQPEQLARIVGTFVNAASS
jgi:pimeloyl-ACP methyl ester carboxylesterase